MSGGPRVRSMNLADLEQRPVLVPAGNKARTIVEARKPAIKPQRKAEGLPETETNKDKKQAHSSPTFLPLMRNLSSPSILRHQHGNQLLRSNLSLNASCSSDASTDSSHSRASTGRISRSSVQIRRKRGASKLEKVDNRIERVVGHDGVVADPEELVMRKRCAWVTPNTEDPSYARFHDEEWGVPVHDDSKLFELLSFAVALAELTWPTILSKRNIFREVFLDFNPVSVAKLNDKKIGAPGTPGSTILSELKLRNIVENARQVCKDAGPSLVICQQQSLSPEFEITFTPTSLLLRRSSAVHRQTAEITDEFGSFDKYIWGFMNHKPMVNKFRYPRQVPVKTSKADVISKDLVRRGFRGVGPTVVYSFMQAAGLTNDHLITCFRFLGCVAAGEGIDKEDPVATAEEEKPGDVVELELARALEEMSIPSDQQFC